MLLVQTGWIHSFHQDRRNSWTETRVGEAARRRKPPPEVLSKVGSGALWVAKGEFEILERDAQRHQRGQTMRLEVRGIMMFVSHLKASAMRGTDTQRWAFAALFEPSMEQLEWIQGQKPTPVSSLPANGTSERDSLLDFLRELAYPDDETSGEPNNLKR